MLRNGWIIPLLPVAAFWLILFVGKRLPRKGAELGILATGGSLVLSFVAAYQWIDRVTGAEGGDHGGTEHALRAIGRSILPMAEEAHGAVVEPVIRTFTWWQSGGVEFTFGTHMDGLSVMMIVVVGIISLLVQIYSTEYMKGDEREVHYFAALNLFTAGMLIMAVAPNTVQLLLGWEIMGLCSFMLIGHWWEEKKNSDAAMKAFFTTRTGDIGLLVGISILFFAAGNTFDIVTLNERALAGEIGDTALFLGALALFVAVIGKSGQFPLHTWLPDAMAGPTPVSSIIHAATMVVAGVYLVARLYGVFWEAFDIADGGSNLIAIIGAITIVIAALLAFVQSDIKKVLAYSTISQLGYMVMGLGVGGWTAAVFHLFTHAFFKCLLFLGAGSISHSGSHHSFDMKRDMGGLRKAMPVTFWTFIIGTAALTGFPLTAGFFSKDEIIATAGQGGYDFFAWVGLAGAVLTAAYMTRVIYLTFFGEPRGAAAHHHPHESPKAITVPLMVLAALSLGAGFLNAVMFDIHKFQEWVEPTFAFPGVTHPEFEVGELVLALIAIAIGYGASYAYYWRGVGQGRFVERNALARGGYRILENKYYLDWLYEQVVVAGIKGPIAKAAYWINQYVIDAVVNALGIASREGGRWVYRNLDQRVVDGAVNGAGFTAGGSGAVLRKVQTGKVQQYGALLFGAAAVSGLVLVIVV